MTCIERAVIQPHKVFRECIVVFVLRKVDGLREEMLQNRNLELLSMNGSGKMIQNTKRFWVER